MISSQIVQRRTLSPVAVAVGSVTVTQSPAMWSCGSLSIVSRSTTRPQSVQRRTFSPVAVAVGSVTVSHSPAVWLCGVFQTVALPSRILALPE